MSIYRKVRAVERVFGQLEKEVASFQKATGMHCVSGCGFCCKKPDITATPLEFLPLAFHLFMEGKAPEMYARTEKADESLCMLFAPWQGSTGGGMCRQYTSRGLICRLFGFTAARDKVGQPQLVTCKIIKEGQPLEFQKGKEAAMEGDVAFMRDYYFKLTCIDPELGRQMIPINLAIRHALEAVMGYYAYRRPRKSA